MSAPYRFVWNPTVRTADRGQARWACGQAAFELSVEGCGFAHNQRPDGHNRSPYTGAIARLTVTGCWLHHAATGHLLKSRAAISHILCNRLTDEAGGRASYELDFPSGGVAVLGAT